MTFGHGVFIPTVFQNWVAELSLTRKISFDRALDSYKDNNYDVPEGINEN